VPSFTNILAGIDLTEAPHFDITRFPSGPREVTDHAVWLARLTGARLLFFSALNVSPEALQHLEEKQRTHVARSVEERAQRALADLVAWARREGVEAEVRLVRGRASVEIIRQVLRGGHDLVVVGTHDRGGLRRLLFGSTALKLLRRCPCPVWVTRPGHAARPLNTLVATELAPAGASAVRLGLELGRLMGKPVHVLHAVEYPLDYLWGSVDTDPDTTAYRARVRVSAERALEKQLRQAGAEAGGPGVQVHLTEAVGGPDIAIQRFCDDHRIDLLVMGTIARGGIAGITVGNTAERLLPQVNCSVLAVKPPGFECPIKLDHGAA
jgi:universal stress protein E